MRVLFRVVRVFRGYSSLSFFCPESFCPFLSCHLWKTPCISAVRHADYDLTTNRTNDTNTFLIRADSCDSWLYSLRQATSAIFLPRMFLPSRPSVPSCRVPALGALAPLREPFPGVARGPTVVTRRVGAGDARDF